MRAEAALFWGGEFGDAETLYKQGIETSFQENGVSGSVDDYMSSGKTPAANKVAGKYGFDFSAPCQVTPEFSGNQEEKLEKSSFRNTLLCILTVRKHGLSSDVPVIRN